MKKTDTYQAELPSPDDVRRSTATYKEESEGVSVSTVTSLIEDVAPLALQESYDNAGLLVGDPAMNVTGVLISIDVTEAVIDEAIQHNCNLIVSHHPLIFRGLKKITGQDYIQRSVIKAIKNDIAIYAAHTNLDNVKKGVNGRIADKIGLVNRQILEPKSGVLSKLVTFIPHEHVETVRKSLFAAGAGHIGEYDSCSYNSEGIGTFRAGDDANPYVGKTNTLHKEPETRLEVILPNYLKDKLIRALIQAHPYEEPAYDIYPLSNSWNTVGLGMVGELEKEMSEKEFLNHLKKVFSSKTIRHTALTGRKIKKVSLCGGSGSDFLRLGIAHNADVYVSGDFKYHDFFDADSRILIADIGHYESEQFTKDVFYEIITKKIPNFAVRISDVNTNPINYF